MAFNGLKNSVSEIRKSLKLTQKSFAKLLGVSPRTVEAWEIGKCNPSSTAMKLMHLLHMNPSLAQTLQNQEEDQNG